MYDRCTMQEPSFLNNLEKGRHSHGIVVRVIRKWIHYENNGQGPPLYVGMVLADAKVLASVFCNTLFMMLLCAVQKYTYITI